MISKRRYFNGKMLRCPGDYLLLFITVIIYQQCSGSKNWKLVKLDLDKYPNARCLDGNVMIMIELDFSISLRLSDFFKSTIRVSRRFLASIRSW